MKGYFRVARMVTAMVIARILVPPLERLAKRIAPRDLTLFDKLDVFGRQPYP